MKLSRTALLTLSSISLLLGCLGLPMVCVSGAAQDLGAIYYALGLLVVAGILYGLSKTVGP